MGNNKVKKKNKKHLGSKQAEKPFIFTYQIKVYQAIKTMRQSFSIVR